MKKAIQLLVNVLLLLACVIVLVNCPGPEHNETSVGASYTVGGTVSGLTGTGLVLQNNDGDDLAISSNGTFTFSAKIADGSAYNVTVKTQPTGETCTASNNTGTISGADVTNVSVVCSTNTNLTYTVTYNGNGNTGGNVPIDSNNYQQGQPVTVLGNTGYLVRTGYSFAGWNTQANGSGTTYTQGQTFVMGSANVVLYANWIRVAPVPDTGQTTCYDYDGAVIACGGTGQDGAYSIHPMSFTDNGNGTITDNVTGLLWQKCRMGLSGLDCATGTAATYNWYQASGTYDAIYNVGTTNVCGSLNLAGTGWRLPTDFELMTIVDYGRYAPAIDTAYFPTIAASFYWSSTTYAPNTADAWGVSLYTGNIRYDFPKTSTSQSYVRCVRGQQNASHFIDNGNGTVTDLTTNLMWQQCSATFSGCDTAGGYTLFSYASAISYCESLSLGGFTDWRLPNVKELKSIVDTTKTTGPAVNTTYFPHTIASSYWSSTTDAYKTTMVWGVYFDDGGTVNLDKIGGNYVRCVRGQ